MLGVLAVAYILGRDALRASVPHLDILEFPVGVLLVGLLLWLALRPTAKPVPPPVWRRHEQVVRQMPDPAATSLAAVVDRYIETGEAPDDAAKVLAPEATDEASRTLASLNSRRKRKAHVEHMLHDPGA